MRDRLIELIKDLAEDMVAKCGDECDKCSHGDCVGKLADHLLANGIIVPPVKVGQTVYDITEFIDECEYAEIYEFKSDELTISKCRKTGQYIFSFDGMDYAYDEFGKSVFLTREEAEKALAEREEK